MAWREEHTVACTVCGTTFKTRGDRAKFCPECAKEQQKLLFKKYAEKRKRDRPENQGTSHIRYSDNQEQRQACINCTRPDCTKGECQLIKSLGRKTAKSEELYQSNRERVAQMFHQGMTATEISKQVSVGPQTVSKWIDRVIWEEQHEIP